MEQKTQHIIESTQEIFSSMIMLDVTPGEPYRRKNSKLSHCVSGIIGLAGNTKGLLAIHLPYTAALAITGAFLGMDVEEIDDDVRDAIGELANMLGGNVKAALDPKGTEIQLSMPSCISGDEYSIDCDADAEEITVPFELNGETFLVELQLSKD